jgi:phosphoserine phosphatase
MGTEIENERQVLHLSGQDSDAALTDFCQLLSKEGRKLLHLSQSMVHGALVISAEIDRGQDDAVVERARQFAQKRGLHLEVTRLSHEAAEQKECGVWVTILGNLENASIVAKVGTVLRAHGFTLRKVESIGEQKLRGVNILARSASSIPAPRLVEVRTELLALGPELQVDVAVQRDDVYRGSKRLLCMDVDSTFVKGEFIDELANLCGVKEQVAAITARAMQGELDFEASLRARVELLRGLKVSRARELCDHFDLTPGAADLVTTVKQLGIRVGLVSGGFDFFVETLKTRFDLDFAFANELEIEGDAFTGRVIGTVVDSNRKAQILKDMSHVFGIRLAQTIAAGDGANDIEMLKAAGLGIAYQAKPKLQEVADTRFNQNDRLDTLLYLMGFDADKLVGVCRG